MPRRTPMRAPRRGVTAALGVLLLAGCATASSPAPTSAAPTSAAPTSATPTSPAPTSATPTSAGAARAAVERLVVKGRAPRTGYAREQFGPAWADVDRNGCDTRNDVLRRDLRAVQTRPGTRGCVVVAGTLEDPYTGQRITFAKARAGEVQVDHVVSLSNAWQTGAQPWDALRRKQFANDPLNLLAVDGPTNQAKGDGDAATWLPPRRAAWCPMVARQVAVKLRWQLWVTPAEQAAMRRVLGACPSQQLPR